MFFWNNVEAIPQIQKRNGNPQKKECIKISKNTIYWIAFV